MNPERIERLQAAFEVWPAPWEQEDIDELRPSLRALLAEWEERGNVIRAGLHTKCSKCASAEALAEERGREIERSHKAILALTGEVERLKDEYTQILIRQEERNANNVRAYMEEIERLRKAHEALLNTLGASKHPWIAKVHKNAAAHYAVLRGEGEK